MEESGSSSLVNHEETIQNFNSPDATVPGEVGSGGLYFPTKYDGAGSPVIANVTSVEDLKEKVTLSWRNINVFVPQPGPSLCKRLCGGQKDDEPRVRQILFDVNGKIESGTLLAVMGSSGAGKSTLMNVLAHRNIGQIQVAGTVAVNGHAMGIDINSLSAYVQQEDLFIGSLTVREHLTFQAALRMEKHTPEKRRKERIEEVMLEVLTNPPLLFADEPTSGLDSFMAQSVIASLQRLASSGHTIIILLLAEGRTAYMGTTTEALPYFQRLGYECPTNYNPADYFVQTLAIVPGDEERCRERVKEICDVHRGLEAEAIKSESGYNSHAQASWCRQLRAVLWRSWISNNRDAVVFRIRVFQAIVTALIAGLIYLQIPYDQDGIQNIGGVYFFLVTSASFSNLQGVLFVFPIELPVFLREHKNGMYRSDVYYLAKTLAEVPVFILSPLLLVSISYWMIGYVISTLAPTVTAATSLGPPLMLPLLIFGGFFLKTTSVPVYFVWLKYVSWFMYGFEALIINQWKDYGPIACGNNNSTTTRCVPNGNEAIKFLGFKEDNMLLDIYCLLALLVGFRIISFLFLLRRAYKEQ
ncbi:Protein white [Acropora cervicornis]|uniref:Protein white n=1 Tax=Acropora cervicornis TaxID=6130 RepID=A0AAD9QZJ3_ACRCE|nr:Protein white [Acropora cervicornis]